MNSSFDSTPSWFVSRPSNEDADEDCVGDGEGCVGDEEDEADAGGGDELDGGLVDGDG